MGCQRPVGGSGGLSETADQSYQAMLRCPTEFRDLAKAVWQLS
jgi:hypothetical protein